MLTDPRQIALARFLATYGDELYQVALFLGGTPRVADHLLRASVRRWLTTATSLDDAGGLWLALLDTALTTRDNRRRRNGASRDLSRALLALPVAQRAALGLPLLLGEGHPGLGAVTPRLAVNALERLATAQVLALPADLAIPALPSLETCSVARSELLGQFTPSAPSPTMRAHLATCADCRAFAQQWETLLQRVEGALREELRGRTLPERLSSKLLTLATPPRRPSLPKAALPALATLAVIAALVLPSMLRRPVTVLEPTPSSAPDPQALVRGALAALAEPPAERSGIWHTRSELRWFLDGRSTVPVTTEAWVDAANPARHRLEVRGGEDDVPFELQLGDGMGELSYALTPAYAPSVAGPVQLRLSRGGALTRQDIGTEGLERARRARLTVGAWDLPAAYLRAALASPTLRTLGRQRDGDRLMQIVSFTGPSPLARLSDDVLPATVLLVIGDDGHLRRITETVGATGAPQTNEIIWQLVEERWLPDTQDGAALFERDVWDGRGSFPAATHEPAADLHFPLIPTAEVVSPARLLGGSGYYVELWLPATFPAGMEQALVRWPPEQQFSSFTLPEVVYWGPGRRLVFKAGTVPLPATGERIAVERWSGLLAAVAGQRTVLQLRPQDGHSAGLVIDAVGYTRDELLALVASLRPFDVDTLVEQYDRFVQPPGDDVEATILLLDVLRASRHVSSDEASYIRLAQWYRVNTDLGPPSPVDPYSPPRWWVGDGPIVLESWVRGAGLQPASLRQYRLGPKRDVAGQDYTTPQESWTYSAATDVVQYWESWGHGPVLHTQLASPLTEIVATLGRPRRTLTLEAGPDGTRLVRASTNAYATSEYQYLVTSADAMPYLADLRPITLTTELRIAASEPRLLGTRLYAAGGDVPPGTEVLAQSAEVEREERVALEQAPVTLRTGAAPAAILVRRDEAGENADVRQKLEIVSLAEARERWPHPLYRLPESDQGFTLTSLALSSDPAEGGMAFPTNIFHDIVARGLAVTSQYTSAASGHDITLNQGPAAPLRAYLQSTYERPWGKSELQRLQIAGEEREVWVMSGGSQRWVFVELDGTLLIIEADATDLETLLLPLLDGLYAVRPATSSADDAVASEAIG